MSNRIREICAASMKLEALKKRISETSRMSHRGQVEREAWTTACYEFHRCYPDLFYPGGDESIDALKRDERIAIETALHFLDADPLHFRSGYTKEELWRRLGGASLMADEKARLEGIALRYLEKSIAREFWVMGRVMSKLGCEKFWLDVSDLADDSDDPVKTRASYLLHYRHGISSGEKLRKELHHQRLVLGHRERQ